MLALSDVDYLDPGHTYYTFGEMVTLATNRPLYSFRPDDALHPVPDLAAAQPVISADKKTVTVSIKAGIRYAPPVDREVTSADVKYAFERFFSHNVGGQYQTYFSVIKGAPRRATHGVRTISGIATPDPHTIVFHLRNASGVPFAASLVMPITVPVPEDYAKRYDKHDPSTYNTHVAFTGPYMVSSYKSGRSIQLTRNPNWVAATDYRPAYADSILIKTDASPSRAAQQVASGSNLLLDTNPTASVLSRLQASAPTQLSTVGAGGFRYYSLNTTIKPLNNINVRKAILAGFDRTAARAARGGPAVGDIATHFLPPDLPGFAEAGGAAGFPEFDYFNANNVSGNAAVAAKYMKRAGYRSGRYKGHQRLLLVGPNAEPGKSTIEVAATQLRRLGFRIKLRLVPQDDVYTDWCQVPPKHVAVCVAGWFKDFADPQSMLEPVFKGSNINHDSGNINYSMLNDEKIDRAMNAATTATGDARNQAWANIDKMIVGDAAGIPFLWDKTTLVRAPNVADVPNPYIGLWDLSFASVTA
ncbi:ABC transporter substrate-binding protein [Conexibacter woesei]|uniref:ABC transporter substrate-binding protein n=1 Tax=Conexibacter woesei TaxID=191495 RepID=UPI0004178BC5|nr:ABC transporter substrate-binding protein [Conexibacter woesei]